MEERLAQLTLRFNAIDSQIQSLHSQLEHQREVSRQKQANLQKFNNNSMTSDDTTVSFDELPQEAPYHNYEGLSLLPTCDMTDDVTRVKTASEQLKLSHASLHKVPSHYYTLSLNDRAKLLPHCTSIHMLCKSMILENTKCINSDNSDPKNAKFYCVIMQYTTKLSSDKVMRYLREINSESKLGKRQFYFRLAREEDQAQLTGYKFNAVSPVGMTQFVPIIFSKAILNQNLSHIFLGGGEVDVKLQVNVREFIDRVKPLIADVTDPDPTKTGDSVSGEEGDGDEF